MSDKEKPDDPSIDDELARMKAEQRARADKAEDEARSAAEAERTPQGGTAREAPEKTDPLVATPAEPASVSPPPTSPPPSSATSPSSISPAPAQGTATRPQATMSPPPANDLEAASYQFPKMHPEGTKYVVIAAAITLFLWFIVDWDILGWLMAGLTVWVFTFFRDPARVTPEGGELIVSPADGLISHVVTVPAPRQIAGEGLLEEESYTRISVFMSVFDVHVNRSPVAGRIKRISYVPGKFVNAELDKASEDNERQYFVIEREGGAPVGVTQIAGLVARRIVKFVREGDIVSAGERIGLIRFGSRVDVFLPAGYVPKVAVGQRAIAGETVLASVGGARVTGHKS